VQRFHARTKKEKADSPADDGEGKIKKTPVFDRADLAQKI
jgi:hypothetical protein